MSLVVTIPHRLGREGARRRIDEGIGSIGAQLAPFAVLQDCRWDGDHLRVRLVAMGSAVVAKLEVLDDVVRVELGLPGILGFFGKRIAREIRQKGTRLLC